MSSLGAGAMFDLKSAHTDPSKIWEGTVVDNNDPLQLGRVRVRVDLLFDEYEVDLIPWATVLYPKAPVSNQHTMLDVPELNSRVDVRFIGGLIESPQVSGYHMAQPNIPVEAKTNYPYRTVDRISTNTLYVYDKKDNILYLRNTGKTKILLIGDVEVEYKGNVTEIYHGQVKREYKSDVQEKYGSNHKVEVSSNNELHVGGTRTEYCSGDTSFQTGGTMRLESSQLQENPHDGTRDPGSVTVEPFQPWPGIPNA